MSDAYEIIPSDPTGGEVVSVIEPDLASLTSEQDMFAMAVLEYAGNLKLAYKSVFGEDSYQPNAKARQLMMLPQVAARVRDLTEAVADNALVSMGSHLLELAEIRDLAKGTGQLKTALEAERARGVVAGYYAGKESSKPQGNNGQGGFTLVIQNNVDVSI